MKQKLIKVIMSFACFAFVFSFAYALTAGSVTAATLDPWGAGSDAAVTENTLMTDTGLTGSDPRTVIANVINTILGFLGVVAVVIILMGGFKYMIAGGDETKIGEARALLVSGIIGLIIILGAFGIASFVVKAILGATAVTP